MSFQCQRSQQEIQQRHVECGVLGEFYCIVSGAGLETFEVDKGFIRCAIITPLAWITCGLSINVPLVT